jgi:hypothetical protein
VPVQFAVDEALARGVKTAGAKGGMAVVIDNKTGEILALSNYPTFDPNRLDSINSENLTDSVVQSVYSPGSVFKLITYGAALENKLITPDQEIDAGNGTIEIAKHKFILIGMLTFLILVPLAVTSTNGWIRRLGKTWTKIHRLVYVAAITGTIHYLWGLSSKEGATPTFPILYAATFAVLLGYRVVNAWRRARSTVAPG